MVNKWLKAIEKRVTTAKTEGEEFGACFLPNPNGGPPFCVQLDEATCSNLKGTFVGGSCVAAESEAKIPPENKKPTARRK
jgi:hypothetical protein